MKDTTNGRTAEQRKAQAEALQASLIEQVQLLADSGQWRRFLDFARSFHTYSLNNMLLILAQNPDATMVAGFRQWQAKGRQVRKGEHAINIFGYSAKKTVGNDDSDSDAVERIAHYYPVLSVFDISQTDPIDGIPLPQNPIHQLTGKGDHGVIRPLTAQLEALGWTVARAPLTHANGHTDPEQHRITLSLDLAPEQAAKTLIHETAHLQLGHVDDLDEYRHHRGRMEVEAESVAYVVAGLAGFDTSAYSVGYITGWANEDVQQIRDTASRVLHAAHAITSLICA
ncbi:ArdC-like ssDNA-binding domain-containing protein [Leifsonia sp. fls2-241-R2A-40a]|jgi:antirestriction protein ArdC|uniref:ArdC-like ssDNA-binding domain-containing protein n=1 Tax=Leifsonia sp. fls2-241-R2A-40a TaxID=3040290 RepID=UPI00254CD935|nr:ArdC-like ssDNA-binding domain-containing protein [Leifsonia sp. fls2-241-R2A-40a]